MQAIHEHASQSGWQTRMPEYWLCHCEGFKVETPLADHVGFVEEVVWSPDDGFVEALVVRQGFGDDGRLTVPVERILSVYPEASLIVAVRGTSE
jgi:hypothetical protein